MNLFNPVAAMVDAWQGLRAELRAIDEADHPPVTDRYGREWTWQGGSLYSHDSTLAVAEDTIRLLPLPPARLAANPNYGRLCGICTQNWPASP